MRIVPSLIAAAASLAAFAPPALAVPPVNDNYLASLPVDLRQARNPDVRLERHRQRPIDQALRFLEIYRIDIMHRQVMLKQRLHVGALPPVVENRVLAHRRQANLFEDGVEKDAAHSPTR